MPKIKVNDINIYYEEMGSGEPLVFIPGLSGTTKLWYKQFPYFSKYYRVISLDNRGAGETDKPESAYSMELFSKDLAGLLDALNINEKIYLVGVSMGGIIAQAFIHEYPDRVKKLGLVCTGVAAGCPEYVQMTPENFKKIAFMGSTKEEKIKTIMELFFYPDYIKNHPEVKETYLNSKIEAQSEYAFKLQLQACMDNRPYFDWLKDIKVPVIVMHGRQDIVWQLANAEVLKRGIGEACEFYVMENAGHMFFFEKEDEFNKRLHEFLKK